jgi:acetoin utilization deacetylase AcuC-like enzyme
MSLLLVHTDRFVEHQTPPGHPERPERAEVMDVVADKWRARGIDVVAPRAATREQLLRVHDSEYLRRVSETTGRAVRLDPDTFTSPESHEVALLAAGAAVDAVERVMSGSHHAALALVRPPGHHAPQGHSL